jgi:hypothetical protein
LHDGFAASLSELSSESLVRVTFVPHSQTHEQVLPSSRVTVSLPTVRPVNRGCLLFAN